MSVALSADGSISRRAVRPAAVSCEADITESSNSSSTPLLSKTATISAASVDPPRAWHTTFSSTLAFMWSPCSDALSFHIQKALSFDIQKFEKAPKKDEKGWSITAVQEIHRRNVGRYLPWWSYKSAVLEHPSAAFPGHGVQEAKTLAFLGLAITWISYFVFSVVACATLRCPYQLPYWWNALCWPLIIVLFALEFAIFRNLIVWHTMRASPFPMPYLAALGCTWQVKFGVWFALRVPLSILAHWDMFNTAQMMLQLYGYAACNDLAVLRQFAQASWWLTLVQPVVVLLLTVKISKGKFNTTFNTLVQEDTNDTYAASSLASCSRMKLCIARRNACEESLDKFPPDAHLVNVKSEVWQFYLCTCAQGVAQLGVKTAVLMTTDGHDSWLANKERFGWVTTAGLLAYAAYAAVDRVGKLAKTAGAESSRRKERHEDSQEKAMSSIHMERSQLWCSVFILALTSTVVVGCVIATLGRVAV